MNYNIWSFVFIFFMTLGVITLMSSFIWQNVITGSLRGQVSGFKYSSPIFAFIGSVVAMFLMNKSLGKSMSTNDMFVALVVGMSIIMLYTAIPNYLPPSFAIIAP